ncbi:TlpA family protein disulfide reductase [Candidatus Pacearchaeota archaeon]|nr:TlpA family protein disulfide reductase [Candidatus Pacearchaeota archaeon]
MKKVLSYAVPLALAVNFFMPYGLRASPDREESGKIQVSSTVFEDSLYAVNGSNWINSEPLQFALNDVTRDLDLRGLEAKAVLLNFWGIWCGYCRADAPKLEGMWQKYKDSGLVIVALHDYKASIGFDEVADFAREKKLTYPIGMDDSENPTFRRYAIRSVPYQVLIDGNGKIIEKGHPDKIRAVVDSLMGN